MSERDITERETAIVVAVVVAAINCMLQWTNIRATRQTQQRGKTARETDRQRGGRRRGREKKKKKRQSESHR